MEFKKLHRIQKFYINEPITLSSSTIINGVGIKRHDKISHVNIKGFAKGKNNDNDENCSRGKKPKQLNFHN
jgi:hypothetical protein